MNRTECEDFLNSLGDQFRPTGGVSKDVIKDFENKININLPNSYKWYLREYGSGGIEDILGIGFDNYNTCLECLEDYRKLNMPKEYIPVLDYGDIVFCLDTSTGDYTDCKVLVWYPDADEKSYDSDTFYEFIYKRFTNILEDK